MASGGSRSFRGAFTGTGAQLDIKVPGFRPKHVKILNRGGLCTLEWMEGMPDASGYKTVTAGTESFITSNGLTPLADGFRLGADADLNVSGELCYYVVSD